ncbi:MAG: cytochrome c, partial [Planctomycetota bacterium]
MTFLPLALTCLVAAQSVGRAGDTPYDPERFELEVLASGMDKPLELAVSPDGRVFIVQQTGEVFCYEPQSGALTLAAKLDVFSEQENGLLGIALDPDFASNNWVYLYYSPSNHMGQFISRFEVHGSQIDLVSEKVVMSWIEQRRECCHHGGSLAFGPDGNLFLSTGDNTNPFDSSGHAPIDDRPEKFPWDARRSSANSMTFGGKVLRIHPTPNGGYQIPAGNLFTDTAKGRPEIYVMGCRNPWRISVDEQTGYLYWGDVGPDASDDGERGPRGYDELNQAKAAGFFGWPLFIGDNFAYRSYDYESESLGAPYDALQPWNNSANNSGMRQLPAAQPAWIYYPYADSEEYPLFESGSRSACAGPVYNFDEGLASAVKFPVEFDEALFVYEWSRHWVNVIHLTGDSEIESVERLPGGFSFRRPADMAFGPEGALYVLEYGTTWGSNDDSQLVRIDYVRGNRKPSARVSASVTAGSAPLEVQLSSEGTADKDGDELE